MPSDHAAIAGAIAAGLWLVHRGFAAAATALGLLLAFARVYAGVHYPGDVVVALVLAALITLLVIVVLRHSAVRLVRALAHTRAAGLVTTGGSPPRHGRGTTSSAASTDDAEHRANASDDPHLWTRPTMPHTRPNDPFSPRGPRG